MRRGENQARVRKCAAQLHVKTGNNATHVCITELVLTSRVYLSPSVKPPTSTVRQQVYVLTVLLSLSLRTKKEFKRHTETAPDTYCT